MYAYSILYLPYSRVSRLSVLIIPRVILPNYNCITSRTLLRDPHESSCTIGTNVDYDPVIRSTIVPDK
jgi:hypothetical protein